MKRRIVCAICILAFLLCGCVPTPEEEYVVNKGDDKAGEAIEATAVSSEPIVQPVFPEHWEDDIKTDNAEMVIDADIITAGQETYPVHLVGKHSFTPEEIALAANVFFDNMTGVQEGAGSTKEDYEAALRAVADKDLKEETRALQMESLNGWIKETLASESKFADSTSFSADDFSNRQRIELIVRQSDGRNGNLSSTGRTLMLSKCSICPVQTKSMIEKSDGEGYVGEKDASFTAEISAGQAVSAAESFLEKIGAVGFELAESDEARYLNMFDLSVMSTGWMLQYSRSFGYCAINATSREAANGQRIGKVTGDQAYSRSWQCEWIEIYVSRTGVEYLVWHSPLEDKGVANENVRLMDFETISGIVKRYFAAKMGDPDFWSPLYFRIEEMTLTVLPSGKKDSDDAYMMPVWVCKIGYYHSMSDDSYSAFYFPGEQHMADWYTVAFNAIDGTRVVVPIG